MRRPPPKMMISGKTFSFFGRADQPSGYGVHHCTFEQRSDQLPGVARFTCHDHQFVQTTANRIMEILPNGALIDKMTTYDEYLASDEMARKRHVYTMTEEDN